MQNLDVISVNLWQILISLINLLLLFLIVKRFLFKPVNKMLAKRESEIEEQYENAKTAESEANSNREKWEEKLASAQTEADEILQKATDNAKYRSEAILSEAKERADGIIRMAETEAQLERKKATESIKREIVEVSSTLTEKMLEREINTDDHRTLIDSFIEDIGEGND